MADRKPGDEYESRGMNGHLYWRRVTEYKYASGEYRSETIGHSENCRCAIEPWEFEPEGEW